MKKITKIIFLLILLVQFFLHAETKRTYTESTNIVNNYISRYSNSNKYFIFPSKYIVNDNATIGEFAIYKIGGQLSRNEFWASRVSRYYRYSYIYSSYLATGKEFWVHSQYTIDSNLLYNSGSGYKAATRVTEYVKPEIEVTGNGTFNSPWEFVEGYFVDIIPTSTEYGTVAPKSKFVKSGESFDVSIVPNTGYTFDGTNDCGLKSTEIPNRYTIDNVDRDITCVIPFDYIVYEFNLNSDISYQTEPQPSVIYYRIGKGFYKDRALKTKITKLTTVPTYSNYMFDGYYYNGTLIISKTGDINQEMPTFNYNNTSQYLTAQRGNYLIDYESQYLL